jgi:hypothetical protein
MPKTYLVSVVATFLAISTGSVSAGDYSDPYLKVRPHVVRAGSNRS